MSAKDSVAAGGGRFQEDGRAKSANTRIISLVESAIKMGGLETAILLAEQLGTASNATTEEVVLLARTYFLSNEPKRCLSLLEQKDLLCVQSLDIIASYLINICGSNDGKYSSNFVTETESRINGLVIAGQSLLLLSKSEDCINLLNSVLKQVEENVGDIESWSNNIPHSQINPLAIINCIIGKCMDLQENRVDAIRHLRNAVIIDVSCIEAAEYLINKGLLNTIEKRQLYERIPFPTGRREFESLYRILLLNEFSSPVGPFVNQSKSPEPFATPAAANTKQDSDNKNDNNNNNNNNNNNALDNQVFPSDDLDFKSGPLLIRQAEYYYNKQRSDEAYKLAVKAYHMDPFDKRCLVVYIATLVDLGFKNELFYLGHELSFSNPKSEISWYAVGCYYYACGKYEMAHKHLAKSTKINKRFVYSWIALGNVFSAQDESEHAVTVYRTAMRSAPGDFRPMLLLAKELSKGNNFTMALQILSNCVRMEPGDPVILNEFGVVLLKMERNKEACRYLRAATSLLITKKGPSDTSSFGDTISSESQFGEKLKFSNKLLPSKHCALEILNNYAISLRRLRNYTEALEYFSLCLSLNPLDPDIHVSIAFTYHLARKFDEAVTYYHRSLAIRANNSFCIEMLHRAMTDKGQYESYDESVANAERNADALDRSDNASEGNFDDFLMSSNVSNEM